MLCSSPKTNKQTKRIEKRTCCVPLCVRAAFCLYHVRPFSIVIHPIPTQPIIQRKGMGTCFMLYMLHIHFSKLIKEI